MSVVCWTLVLKLVLLSFLHITKEQNQPPTMHSADLKSPSGRINANFTICIFQNWSYSKHFDFPLSFDVYVNTGYAVLCASRMNVQNEYGSAFCATNNSHGKFTSIWLQQKENRCQEIARIFQRFSATTWATLSLWCWWRLFDINWSRTKLLSLNCLWKIKLVI